MSLRLSQLRILIQWFYLPENRQISKLRADIRDELGEDDGLGGGGDFHIPFWSDAKGHVVGSLDLHQAVQDRIAANDRRRRLYPELRDGFLGWFNRRRRWTNAPFRLIETPRTRLQIDDDCIVKIDNFLAVSDARGQEHFVYPYFCEEPVLSAEAARLCLWAIGRALPNLPMNEVRVLDVIRGMTFSLDRTPLNGDEEQIFGRRLAVLRAQRARLILEYPR